MSRLTFDAALEITIAESRANGRRKKNEKVHFQNRNTKPRIHIAAHN